MPNSVNHRICQPLSAQDSVRPIHRLTLIFAASGPRLRVRAGVRRGARPRVSLQEVLLPLEGEALGGGLAEALDGERHSHSRHSNRLSLVTLDIHGSLLVTSQAYHYGLSPIESMMSLVKSVMSLLQRLQK